MIQTFGNGGLIVTGSDILLYRLLALKHALRLEVETGIKFSNRHHIPNQVRSAIGSTTRSKAKLLTELTAFIERKYPPTDGSDRASRPVHAGNPQKAQ